MAQNSVSRIVVGYNQFAIHLSSNGGKKVLEEALNVSVTIDESELVLNVVFKTGRASRGAKVIKAEGETDIFDLPPEQLKKLVQGLAWREAHFGGQSLRSIARAEGCSDKHVRNAIHSTFEIGQAA